MEKNKICRCSGRIIKNMKELECQILGLQMQLNLRDKANIKTVQQQLLHQLHLPITTQNH
jgi:hypothetical protein